MMEGYFKCSSLMVQALRVKSLVPHNKMYKFKISDSAKNIHTVYTFKVFLNFFATSIFLRYKEKRQNELWKRSKK